MNQIGNAFGGLVLALSVLGVTLASTPVQASFHIMEIEQVIGGVNGDTSMQAIQLRMRSLGQNLVSGTRLVARDANGANPITLITFGSNVANSASGSRILVASANFRTSPAMVPNFTLTHLIPASYLAAGRLTFESDLFGTLWSLSWGGAAYTGPNTGSTFNDLDGNFGPPFASALPSDSLKALLYKNGLNVSTNNAADYAITAGAAVFTNNAGASFTVTPIIVPADFNKDGHVDHADITAFLACASGPGLLYDLSSLPAGCTLVPDAQSILPADFDRDGDIDQDDFGRFQRCYSGATRPPDPACAG